MTSETMAVAAKTGSPTIVVKEEPMPWQPSNSETDYWPSVVRRTSDNRDGKPRFTAGTSASGKSPVLALSTATSPFSDFLTMSPASFARRVDRFSNLSSVVALSDTLASVVAADCSPMSHVNGTDSSSLSGCPSKSNGDSFGVSLLNDLASLTSSEEGRAGDGGRTRVPMLATATSAMSCLSPVSDTPSSDGCVASSTTSTSLTRHHMPDIVADAHLSVRRQSVRPRRRADSLMRDPAIDLDTFDLDEFVHCEEMGMDNDDTVVTSANVISAAAVAAATTTAAAGRNTRLPLTSSQASDVMFSGSHKLTAPHTGGSGDGASRVGVRPASTVSPVISARARSTSVHTRAQVLPSTGLSPQLLGMQTRRKRFESISNVIVGADASLLDDILAATGGQAFRAAGDSMSGGNGASCTATTVDSSTALLTDDDWYGVPQSRLATAMTSTTSTTVAPATTATETTGAASAAPPTTASPPKSSPIHASFNACLADDDDPLIMSDGRLESYYMSVFETPVQSENDDEDGNDEGGGGADEADERVGQASSRHQKPLAKTDPLESAAALARSLEASQAAVESEKQAGSSSPVSWQTETSTSGDTCSVGEKGDNNRWDAFRGRATGSIAAGRSLLRPQAMYKNASSCSNKYVRYHQRGAYYYAVNRPSWHHRYAIHRADTSSSSYLHDHSYAKSRLPTVVRRDDQQPHLSATAPTAPSASTSSTRASSLMTPASSDTDDGMCWRRRRSTLSALRMTDAASSATHDGSNCVVDGGVSSSGMSDFFDDSGDEQPIVKRSRGSPAQLAAQTAAAKRERIKFRFRMKFQSPHRPPIATAVAMNGKVRMFDVRRQHHNPSAASVVAAAAAASDRSGSQHAHHVRDAALSPTRARRQSALNNIHCPSPVKKEEPQSDVLSTSIEVAECNVKAELDAALGEAMDMTSATTDEPIADHYTETSDDRDLFNNIDDLDDVTDLNDDEMNDLFSTAMELVGGADGLSCDASPSAYDDGDIGDIGDLGDYSRDSSIGTDVSGGTVGNLSSAPIMSAASSNGASQLYSRHRHSGQHVATSMSFVHGAQSTVAGGNPPCRYVLASGGAYVPLHASGGSSSSHRPMHSGQPHLMIMTPEKCSDERAIHNSLERQRRVDLNKHFDRLKGLVPTLHETDRASKLNILIKSTDYIHAVAEYNGKLFRLRERLMARYDALRQRLTNLKNGVSNGDGRDGNVVDISNNIMGDVTVGDIVSDINVADVMTIGGSEVLSSQFISVI